MKSRLIKLFAIAGLGLFGLTTPALAASGAGQGPDTLIKQNANELLSEIRANEQMYQQQPRKLYALVNDVVLPNFDVRYMSRLVLGRYWRQASEAQQDRFVDAFKALLVRTYGNSLLEYNDGELEVMPVQAADDADDVTVRTTVSSPKLAQPIPINYRLHKVDGDWKVYEVTVEGISLVTNYRSSYGSIIRSQGIDTLIQRIEEKASQEEAEAEK